MIRLFTLVGGCKELDGTKVKIAGDITSIEWTGRQLTAGTADGFIYTFLTAMPSVCTSHGTHMAFLSSLQEVTIIDTDQKNTRLSLPMKIEPTIIALGPTHLAVGRRNEVIFYGEQDGEFCVSSEEAYDDNIKVREIQTMKFFLIPASIVYLDFSFFILLQ